MLCLRNVSYAYKKKIPAIQNINLTVNPGEIVVLLGNNGAGKTTIMHAIAGFLKHEGSITLGGFDNTSIEAKARLGFIPEIPAVFDFLTLADHLEYVAAGYHVANAKVKIQELSETFALTQQQGKLGKELSKGMKQKLNICAALLHDPPIVVFDEPFIGLDPSGIKNLKERLHKKRAEGKSILICTHILESVETLWDKAYFLATGQIVAQINKTKQNSTGKSLETLFFEHIKERT